jgi:hypothetical protein
MSALGAFRHLHGEGAAALTGSGYENALKVATEEAQPVKAAPMLSEQESKT